MGDRRVLVVEPDKTERSIVERWIQNDDFDSTGITVEVTGNYGVALAKLLSQHYDYVSLGIDGASQPSQMAALMVLKELKRANQNQGKIVLYHMVPFDDAEAVGTVALALGANGYVQKAQGYMKPEGLIELVEQCLREPQSRERPWWKLW